MLFSFKVHQICVGSQVGDTKHFIKSKMSDNEKLICLLCYVGTNLHSIMDQTNARKMLV